MILCPGVGTQPTCSGMGSYCCDGYHCVYDINTLDYDACCPDQYSYSCGGECVGNGGDYACCAGYYKSGIGVACGPGNHWCAAMLPSAGIPPAPSLPVLALRLQTQRWQPALLNLNSTAFAILLSTVCGYSSAFGWPASWIIHPRITCEPQICCIRHSLTAATHLSMQQYLKFLWQLTNELSMRSLLPLLLMIDRLQRLACLLNTISCGVQRVQPQCIGWLYVLRLLL